MKENEIQEYLDSYIKPLQECKNAIIERVSDAYHERKMNEVLSEICKNFGYERVSLLVANHVKAVPWDGRYDKRTRDWTNNQPHIKRISNMSIDTYEMYCRELSLGNTHPVIVNSMAHWIAENEKNKELFKAPTEEKNAKNRLIQRVENELNAYENWLLELPKKEILNHTHEYSVLCDIVFLIRDEDVISETTSEKLLLSRDILSDLSKDLEKFDLNINEEICTVIEERAKKLAEKSKEPSIDLVM